VFCRAFYVEGHDPERSNGGPLSLALDVLDGRFIALNFNLTKIFFIFFFQHVLSGGNAHPSHAGDALVDHEAEGERNVAFEGFCG
jgi:hypothetical protein